MGGEEVMVLRQEPSMTTAIYHHTKIYNAIEELILLGQDFCYVKKGDQIIGVVYLQELLKKYHDDGISAETIEKFIIPFFSIKKIKTVASEKTLMDN